MGPAAISDVSARIASIERRFAPPPQAFQAMLQTAVDQTPPARPAGPAQPAGTVPTTRQTAAAPASPANGLPASASGPVGAWASALPPAGRAWAGEVERAAVKAGVDPALLASLVWAESGFQPAAKSHAGAIGLAQLMPATAAGLGVDPHDPAQNLEGGARFLRSMLDQFGTPALALAAYNAGPGRVARAGGIPNIAETQAYVPKVLGYYDQLRGAA